MCKVKIFKEDSMYNIEKQINEFLHDRKLIGTSINTTWAGHTLYYIVCVSYEI